MTKKMLQLNNLLQKGQTEKVSSSSVLNKAERLEKLQKFRELVKKLNGPRVYKADAELNALLDELNKAKEKIPGGLAEGKSPKDFDAKALAQGVKVEMEHTTDPKIAQEIAMDHLAEDLKYYIKLATIEKSIASNPMAEIDINTAEQSMDEMASRGSDHWVMAIDAAVSDAGYGDNPESIPLPQFRTLYISKVDDGIYSAIVKNEDPNSGDSGATIMQLSKMTPEAMVQSLKAKGYIYKEETQATTVPEEPTPPTDKYDKLKEILSSYARPEIHIHLDA